MTSKPFSLWFRVAALVLFVFSGTFVSSQKIITSTSGREIPTHLIQEQFKKQLTASDFDRNIIYELTDGNVIQGPDLHIDLQSDVQPGHVTHSSKPAVTLNGNERASSSMRLITLKANSYNIIINDESGQIISVTGNGILLMPLGEAEFSDIFVNKMAFMKPMMELSTDSHGEGVLNSSRNILRYEQSKESQGSKSLLVSETGISTRQATGSCRSGTTHYLEIAIAYDNTFCNLFNNVESLATEVVQIVVDEANEAYARNTCVQLALVHVEAHCNDVNDPYQGFTTFDYQQILDEFRFFWIDNRQDVPRDAAYLLTGFQDSTTILGEAFIGTACDAEFGYGWMEGANSVVFAHEVGHTLDGEHTGGGVMRATIPVSAQLRFSRASVRDFTDFIDTDARSSCITTTRPPGLIEGPSTGDDTCESGFSRNRALACRNRLLRSQTVSLGGSTGRLRTNLQQRNGQLILRYRATGGLFITRFRDLVTTNEIVAGGRLGRFTNVAGTERVVVSSRDAGAITRPSEASTCCGQRVFVVWNVRVCVNSSGGRVCETLENSSTSTIGCLNICFPNTIGVFTPMSADQACPSCV